MAKITLLETIQSSRETILKLVDERKSNNKAAIEFISKEIPNFKEIVFVGSGSSLNEVRTARSFIEKVTKKRVTFETSNDFINNHSVFETDNLYIFVSQSGTSTTTRIAQKRLKEMGCKNICVSAFPLDNLGKETGVYVDSMCAHEAYYCVTLGFNASAVCLELLGLSIAEFLKTVSSEEVKEYEEDLRKAADNYPALIDKTVSWYKKHEKELNAAKYYACYGPNDLWGVAIEFALKLQDVSRLFAVGYELEDGMHGPCMSFGKDLCLFVLDDNTSETKRAKQLVRFGKEQCSSGFLIGPNSYDENDLVVSPVSKHFQNIEMAPVVQTICCMLGETRNIDSTPQTGTKSVDEGYFNTHEEIK